MVDLYLQGIQLRTAERYVEVARMECMDAMNTRRRDPTKAFRATEKYRKTLHEYRLALRKFNEDLDNE